MRISELLCESELTGDALRLAAESVRKQTRDRGSFSQTYNVADGETTWQLQYLFDVDELLSDKVYEKMLMKAVHDSGVKYKSVNVKYSDGVVDNTRFCFVQVKI